MSNRKRQFPVGRFALTQADPASSSRPLHDKPGGHPPVRGPAGANFTVEPFDSSKIQGGKMGNLSGDFVNRVENHLMAKIEDKILDIFTYGPEANPRSSRRAKRKSSADSSESSNSSSSKSSKEEKKRSDSTPPPKEEKKRSDSTTRPKEEKKRSDSTSRPKEEKKFSSSLGRPKGVLTVKNVNLNSTINGQAHHTSRFDISAPSKPRPQLVIRRGQHFSIEVDFSRPYDEQLDDLLMIFEIGDTPLQSRGTYVEFNLSAVDKPKKWRAWITSAEGSQVSIEIYTPPKCFVGKWNFKFDVIKADGSSLQVFRYEHKDPIYIIFNPWCKDDTVYMQDKKLLDEYVMNEFGRIYTGSRTCVRDRPWNFGQFESCVLDVALYLLDNGRLSWPIRGDPVHVVREISAMVNSLDDDGVLIDNWSGDYSNGTPPLSWTGSVPILEEYWNHKRSVGFGQCCAFSGVCTTLCRALGIPARSVTNFESGHDTDGSITMDDYFTASGQPDSDMNKDCVWNFHVWNEAWMARPDLPAGYGGWQAFDATPQEISDGVHCSGPTSVAAVQKGVVNLPYDTAFVFAEVNADRFYWRQNNRGIYDCVYMDKKAIGRFLLTKAVEADAHEDITHLYKFPEGSPEERAAVLKANQIGSTRRDLYKRPAEEVKFKILQDPNTNWVGSDFQVGFTMKNTAAEKRTVTGCFVIKTMFYTGISAETLQAEPFSINLKKGEDASLNLIVTPEEYMDKLKDYCMLDVTALARVDETDQNFCTREAYTLQKPQLSVRAPTTVKYDKEFKADVSFTNPFNTTLTNCSVSVDGVTHAIKFPQGNVAANGPFTATLPVVPSKLGQQMLIIVFNSRQLEDINAAVPVNVKTK